MNNKAETIVHDADVASPCISVCALDEHDVCQGCYRTLAEIGRWGLASDDEKSDILAASLQRQDADR